MQGELSWALRVWDRVLEALSEKTAESFALFDRARERTDESLEELESLASLAKARLRIAESPMEELSEERRESDTWLLAESDMLTESDDVEVND